MSNASEFYDWKKHPITQEVFIQLKARVDYLKDELVNQVASNDPRLMAEKAGIIKGFEFLLNIDYEESRGN